MRHCIAVVVALAAPALWAQDEYPLWEGEVPFSKPNDLVERVVESWGVPCLVDVTEPTLTVHAASDPIARQALILMREMAEIYGFDPSRVGVLGFSAGGHLATTVSVLPSEDERGRADFSVLLYPVTTLEAENLEWLEETLFHRTMTPAERVRYSLVDHVAADTPPALLVHAWDDEVVPISESERYAAALISAGQEAEVHFFASGGHGFGPGRDEDGTSQRIGLAADWIRRR